MAILRLAVLALVALLALHTPVGIALVWVFNIWDMLDLLYAFYLGLVDVRIEPGLLGSTYFISTLVVPLLFVTHALIFLLLIRYPPAGTASP